MKKGKAFKSVALVALSAVLAGGVAMTAAGCGGGNKSTANDPVITVSMFSSNIDKSTNQMIADNWVKAYNDAHDTHFEVKLDNQTSKDEYYKQLGDMFKNDSIGDVMYVSPRNVRTFAMSGRIIDLTEYINDDPTAQDNVSDVWSNAIAYYGYDTSRNAYTPDPTGAKSPYTMGQAISYEKEGANGAGFYTADGKKAGIFGLPKDYSNFSMGYNHRFFTQDLKKAYTSTKATQRSNIQAARGNTGSPSKGKNHKNDKGELDNLVYNSDSGVITYAVGGEYTNPVTGKTETVTAGQDAYIINIGVPVNIKPYNFYMYASYTDALLAGDPMATLVDQFTNHQGYTVTIPGFPDETFTMPDTIGSGSDTMTVKKEGVSYNGSMGHVVYTYAEYGALLWSLTYYLNTFAWDGKDNTDCGGVMDSTGEYRTVYGGEQYEGGEQDGAQLYLLPWLFSNDADLINQANALCISSTDATQATADADAAASANLTNRQDWVNFAGTASDTVKKLRINGELEDVDVQYGLNSKNFIETYAAFLAIGSDWNGNPGDTTNETTEGSGWDYFREGRGIFYGAGSWDPATRNEEDWASMDFGQMPSPVAEKYALYSNVKGANYEMVTYSNGTGKSPTGTAGKQATGTNVKNADFDGDCVIYSKSDIEKNLACRQDKWGARMDSVGYAVTCRSTDTGVGGGNPTAKTAAAASLCIALTASADSQIWLTYGGAQLPNFVSQCEDLLNYNNPDYENYENGVFKDMITPEGDSAGNDVWGEYYKIAKEMGDAAYKNVGGTVAEFLAGKKIKLSDGTEVDVKYDESFKDFKLNQDDFAAATTTAKSRYSFAMKVLRMVAYREKDFDILIRMQSGLNSVRDSSMYTYNDTWLNPHDARAIPNRMLAYYRSRAFVTKEGDEVPDLTKTVAWSPSTVQGNSGILTPFVFCMKQMKEAQGYLTDARNTEIQDLRSNGVKA